MSHDEGDGRRFDFDPGWFTEVEHNSLCEAIEEVGGWEEIEASYTIVKLTVDSLRRAGNSTDQIKHIVVGDTYDYTAGSVFPSDTRSRMILIIRGLLNAAVEGEQAA